MERGRASTLLAKHRWWHQDIETKQDISDCFDLHTVKHEGYASDGDASSACSAPGRRVNDNAHKRCMIGGGCPYPVEEDFCEDNVSGCRELFLCDSCHQGYITMNVCVRWVQWMNAMACLMRMQSGGAGRAS